MKKGIWRRFTQGLFSKAQFITGVIIVTVLTSVVAYAYQLLSLTSFGTGQAISSSAVNNNFNLLNERLAKSNRKMIVALDSDTTISSSTASYDIFNSVVYDYTGRNYGSLLANNDSFTITEDGVYQLLLVPSAIGSSASASIYVEMERGGSINTITSAGIFGSSLGYVNATEHYLYSGDIIEIKVHSTWQNTTLSGSKTKFIFEKLD
jgi:hypothetical protein